MVGERAGNVDGGGSGKRDKERGASARGRGSSEMWASKSWGVAPWWCCQRRRMGEAWRRMRG